MASQCINEFAADDLENVKKMQKVLQTAIESMANQVSHEDVEIFIGITNSGKSTLINYLLDNNLVGVKRSRILPVFIKNADDFDVGPQIAGDHSSGITIPTRWENSRKIPKLVMWDTPGFDDNRGPIQDITNAFYIYELLKNIRSVKIVLVVNIQHVLREPINPFLSFLRSVENLLQERMRDCFSSIAVIFTKVEERIEIDENLLDKLLKPIWANNSLNMSPVSRDFLRYLCEHSENVGFFKHASEGPVTDAIEVGVSQAIQRASSAPENILKDVLFPSIADSSKVFLYKCRDKISPVHEFKELERVVYESLHDEILGDYSQILVQTGSRNQLHEALVELKALQSTIDCILNSNNGFCENIKTLEKIHSNIKIAVIRRQLVEKFKLMEFIDRLLQLPESKYFDFNLQSVIVIAKSTVEEIIISIKLKLDQMDKNEVDCEIAEIKEQHRIKTEKLKKEIEDSKNIATFFLHYISNFIQKFLIQNRT